MTTFLPAAHTHCAYGIVSAQVKQAFPEGRNGPTKCEDDLLLSKLEPVSTVVAANAVTLPPAIATLAKLMELFPNQSDKLPLYMQQHFLEDHPAAADEEEEPEP